jgi:ubiquinone/menaquinone biosynthesis C-methylase UbiE
MPNVDMHHRFWDSEYDWSRGGDEWSKKWGGATSQWNGTIFPRIRRHLPAHTILEIAPGFGRWTQFLVDQCQRLILVDLSKKCISACQKRFRDRNHVEYHVNDGRSLAEIAESSVDFVFSFDSLVHVEPDVIESYVNDVARILKTDGTAFLHHSNHGEFSALTAIQNFLWSHTRARSFFERLKLMPNSHGRALTMSAAKLREYAERAGMHCTVQETINWGSKRTIDCLSTIRKSREMRRVPTTKLHNPHFMREATYLGQLSRLYAGTDNGAD